MTDGLMHPQRLGGPPQHGWPTSLEVGDSITGLDSTPPGLKPWATQPSNDRHRSGRFLRTLGVLGLAVLTVAMAVVVVAEPPAYSGDSEKLIAPLPLEKPSVPDASGRLNNEIDQFIANRWSDRGVRSAPLCDDLTFVRRVYLDIAGVIPNIRQVNAFKGEGYNRRSKLIDELLGSDRYADHWSTFWGDLLRERTRIRGADPFAFRDYIRDALAKNRPYDQWVREMVAAEGTPIDNLAAAFVLTNGDDRDELTISTTQVFMGVQLKCAQCHDHPFEAWKQSDYEGMRAFFDGTRRRIAVDEEVERNGRKVRRRIFEVIDRDRGTGRFVTEATSGKGRGRQGLADLLTDRWNPYFARTAVNRLWAKLFGAGLVSPPDGFSPMNPPSHPDLLDWLAVEFVENGYDLKSMIRLMCNARTYQLASHGGRRPGEIPDHERLFEKMSLRRMTAEQLHDSLLVTTGLIGSNRRALQPAIEQNHPPRPGSFLATFGAHDRRTIHERSTDATIPQALTLLNGPFINRAVRMHERHPTRLWLDMGVSRQETMNALFLNTLTREPTGQERKFALEIAQNAEGWSDVHWALINTPEFMFIR